MEHDDRCTGERLEAEGEVAVARLVLADGDLAHSARHLADALARDPSLAEAYEGLSEFAARAGGPERALEFFSLDEPFTGTIACHAHLCAAAGRWNDAVRLLVSVAAHEAHRPWLDVAWLRRPDLATLMDPQVVASAAITLASELSDPVDEEDLETVLPFLGLLCESVALHPDHPVLLWCGSAFARRTGAEDEAIAWARHSFAVEPSHQAAVMTGYALRSAGRVAEAVEVWEAEVERVPEDLSLPIDIADALVELDELPRALAWAERAASADPDHPKAAPTAHAIRYRMDGDVAHLLDLISSDLPYAADALRAVSWDRQVLGRPGGQVEAVVNSLIQLLDKVEPSPDLAVTLTVSALEPPSSVLALHQAFPAAVVTFESVPDPDPRTPAYPVTHAVWTYDGTTARPTVPPPSPAVAEAVRQVAAIRWPSLPELHARAATLSTADPADLLATLVHPPATPDTELGRALARHAPNLWLSAVQVAACLGIAHHAVDEPWADSRRRQVLLDLLHGVEDWTTVAAGIALVATAWVAPEIRQDVKHQVAARMVDAAKAAQSRLVTILGPLCELVLVTPEAESDFTALARDLLLSLEE